MWDIKYRPLKFSDVLGQKGAVQLLQARLRKRSALDTSYIFSGGHGQGKTTLARILARAALCQNLDATCEPCNESEQCVAILEDSPNAFEERDAASGGTINIVRGMLDDLPFNPPLNAARRVWLFDEAHRMGNASQDALLKPVEDKKVVLIFCTTEAEAIRGPIRSRCEEHVIRKVTREDILVRMKHILTQEGVEHEDDAVMIVIDHSRGHVRDVINKLEMIAQTGPVVSEPVRQFLNLNTVTTFYQILLALGDARQAIELVEQACERVTPDEVAAGIAEAAMNSFRLANSLSADFAYVDRPLAEQVFQRFGAKNIFAIANYFLRHRSISRIGLTFDVLSLTDSNGVVSIPQSQTAEAGPPIVVSAPALQIVQVPASSVVSNAPVAQPAQQDTPMQQPPSPVTVPAVNGVKKPILAVAPPTNSKLRPDGIGARGSGDSLALTDEDHNGVPQSQPRKQSNGNGAPKPIFDTSGDQPGILTPEAWKQEFARTWPRGQ